MRFEVKKDDDEVDASAGGWWCDSADALVGDAGEKAFMLAAARSVGRKAAVDADDE